MATQTSTNTTYYSGMTTAGLFELQKATEAKLVSVQMCAASLQSAILAFADVPALAGLIKIWNAGLDTYAHFTEKYQSVLKYVVAELTARGEIQK